MKSSVFSHIFVDSMIFNFGYSHESGATKDLASVFFIRFLI